MKQIPLTQGKVALVDDEDFEKVDRYKWHASRVVSKTTGRIKWYAKRNACRARTPKGSAHLYMHRLILDAKPEIQIDHQDNDGLNNTRNNLRRATSRQNAANSVKKRGISSFKGLYRTSEGRWQVQIQINGQTRTLGGFRREMDAARVYDTAAQHYFGEFARLNLPIAELPGC